MPSKLSRRAKHACEYAGFNALTSFVRNRSRASAQAMATRLGRFAFERVGIRRDVAVRNICERLQPDGGEGEAHAIARASYEIVARTFVDLVRGDRTTDQELWSVVRREEIEGLIPVLEEGRGAVLVSGHFGNWELLVLAIRRLGFAVGALAADQANPRVNARVQTYRRLAGIEPLSVRHGLRQTVRCLRDNGFVATLMDQDARGKGLFVPFLGRPASTHPGVVSLAMRTGSPIVPGVLVDQGGHYRFVQGDVWRADPALGNDANVRAGVAHYSAFLEQQVRAAPHNYFWAHRRWKTAPPPETEHGG